MPNAIALPAEPLISVVMPVRDAAAYVGEAVRSIQAQDYPHWELIVVDSSTDGSREIVEAFARQDSRITVLAEPPGSRGRAINTGIRRARGGLIARMDADDVALPERFSVQLDWMRRTGVEICGTCALRFGDEEGIVLFLETHESICRELLFGYALLQPSVLMYADILRRNPYSEDATYEGYELFTRLVLGHRAGSVPAVLIKTRFHGRNAHVVEAEGCRADLRAARTPLFHALFPDATRTDAATIDAVAESEPFATVAGLTHAGEWLSRLADGGEPLLRRRLAQRWSDTCRRSAGLGRQARLVHEHFAARLT